MKRQRCKQCGGKIRMQIQRNTGYCCQRCEVAAKEAHLAAMEAHYRDVAEHEGEW